MTVPDEPTGTAPSPPEAPPGFFDDFSNVIDEAPSNVHPIRPDVALDALEGVPVILLGHDVHRVTDELAAALTADPDLYKRAGALVHVVRETDDDKTAKHAEFVPGSPIIRALPLALLRMRASRFARCQRKIKTENGFVSINDKPPKECVEAIHVAGQWKGISQIRGVIEAPAMRPDGSIIQTRGYDPATRFLYEPNADFPPVDEHPTRNDATQAYAHLADVFCDFPYAGPGHRSAVIAAILTILARPAILGAVPVWFFDASQARSGKTKQIDVIHLVATGRAASRMTYPENDEELEKVLSGYAMRGSPTVNFDNVARKFGGSAIDKVATAVDTVDLRVLGATDLRTFEWRSVIFASGNQMECRGDMLPRLLAPRIESPLENPEARTDFKYPDLLGHARTHRVELVRDALTLMRAYFAAGCPLQPDVPRWGGFEQWSRLIPHALVWAGAEDPMLARRGLAGDEDPERIALGALMVGWERLANVHGPISVKQAIAVLYPDKRGRDPQEPPDGFDDLREAIESLTNAKPGHAPASESVGKMLRRMKSRPFAARRFATSSAQGGVMKWKVVKA